MPTIHINSFVRRQTAESPFSHWTFGDDELLKRVHAGFAKRQPGYRPDVYCVPIDPEGVFSAVKLLQPGDKLIGGFSSRREGEEPRKHTYAANGAKSPAVKVDVVIYSHAALVEDDDAETDADFEIISVNASPTANDMPIHPMTLLANHFGADGGTATGMTAEQLETQLRESYAYWANKAMVPPQGES